MKLPHNLKRLERLRELKEKARKKLEELKSKKQTTIPQPKDDNEVKK